ncbi:MAG: 4Fe-4S dicluster domain-containing protein [Dehalococcoidia bacterium]|jgi:molybdopterin-containing oxidoreductase family iron-sulfur binding subunit|nr:4Fe-4S dicluster domain-containing protein [Dehalococcoidia bacterium]
MDREENLKKWHVSRRRFLQMAGALGATAMAGVALPSALRDGSGVSVAGEDQLGPGEAAAQRRLRKWMMIIDLRACDGCQSQDSPPKCSEACIAGHFVPEPMQWIEVYEHELSSEAELRPDEQPDLPINGTRFMPTPCMQCQNPPCVNVCPVGATWSTPEGPVLIDQDRCIGCRMCMAACPYERRFFTWGEPPIPPESLFVERSPEHQVPLKKGVVAKCDFCPEMARSGRLPFCAQACPQNAIYYGDLEEDIATNGDQVVKVSDFLAENSAFRHKDELGTRPRVYYVPGHGELAGRKPTDHGLQEVSWDYQSIRKGSKSWKRSGT